MGPDLLVEFGAADALLDAVRACRALGLRRLETFTPYPIRDVQEALALPRSRIPWLCLVGGLVGASLAYLAQWWMNGVAWPLNVGGRPLHSAPAFVPITFESGVLGAALGAVVSFLAFAGLPRLWHPVFEVEGFERASVDRFFLHVDAAEVDAPGLREALRRARALRIVEMQEGKR
ncbi:DUF3341 domain-containing protein [Vulgatibacter sp.]|uniref:DUF3341 domain-containing protein n=1 Tax=Vulgatibacter sp. TaxID=1971226 RepID=UPI003569AF59